MQQVTKTFTLAGTPREGQTFDTGFGVVFVNGEYTYTGPFDQAQNLARALEVNYAAREKGADDVSSVREAEPAAPATERNDGDGNDPSAAAGAAGADDGGADGGAPAGGAGGEAPAGNGQGVKRPQPAHLAKANAERAAQTQK